MTLCCLSFIVVDTLLFVEKMQLCILTNVTNK